ncbi:galactose-specific lectin nattectin-like isoform X2 [Ctenopharyngodon idella]|uniref:galactose-specific lectin nattectin-like isoform X2 n=1 Tax=Ctenopharyngodon idella TaxID=7959 RepID=UPI00222FF071|nr:galactose-specific lectin nattectin-like isoform X2 [Ctenopharyngodon idella]
MAILRSFLLLFVIFSMGNAQAYLAKKCHVGWTSFGLRCYKYISQPANWITAERNCQSLGANLASVRNKLENNFLLSLLPTSVTRSWVGAHDGVQEGQWFWSDGTPFLYTNWCSGEPNNQRPENCLEINWTSNRCWNDAPCSILKSYLCVKDL